jgi:hypothetical protein
MINFGMIVPIFNPIGSFIKKYWMFLLPVLLIGANCATLYEWHNTSGQLKTERAAHAADNATFKKTQAEANAKAEAERDRLNKESKASATKADANYSDLLVKYRANLVRYQANQNSGSQSYNYQLPTPTSTDGPSSSTDVFAGPSIRISIDDANVCAINTARLTAVHDWAIALPRETK